MTICRQESTAIGGVCGRRDLWWLQTFSTKSIGQERTREALAGWKNPVFVGKISYSDPPLVCCWMLHARHNHQRVVVKRLNIQMLMVDWSPDLDDGEIELPLAEILINGAWIL